MCVYIYIYVCVCVFIFIYIYIGLTAGHRLQTWALQDIVLLGGVYAGTNNLFIAISYLRCRHYCNAIARLLRNIRRPAPTPPLDLMHQMISLPVRNT